MTLTRGFSFAQTKETEPSATPPPARFDWYSATLASGTSGVDVVEQLGTVYGGTVARGVGRHGYALRDSLMHGQTALVSVSHGGAHDRPLIESSGGASHEVAGTIRRLWPTHHVTRVDSAMDWDDPDAWSELTGHGLAVARARGVKTSVAGDWLDQHDGRTLYIGSLKADVRVRIYEKGRQLPEAGKPDWVRCEAQVRPRKAAKAVLAAVEPVGVWGAAQWSGMLAEAILGAPVERVSMAEWTLPDDLRAKTAVARQYGALFQRWLAEKSGDSSAVLAELFALGNRSETGEARH